jgi:hypothetical protein
MKVIWQQAVRECLCHLRDVFPVKLEELLVIPLFVEKYLPVVSAIVDMIVRTEFQFHGSSSPGGSWFRYISNQR